VVTIGIYDCEDQLIPSSGEIGGISQLLLTVKQGDEFIIGHRRPDLDTDRIADPPKIFDMCAFKLSSPVPNPKEMPRGVVVFLRCQCWYSELVRNS